MSKKIALITAANGSDGIAFEAAKQLGKKHGFELIMTSRSISAGTEAVQTLQSEGVTVSLIQLDVADSKSIESAAKIVKEKWGRLDVLIHSAGLGAPSSRAAELQAKGTVFLSTLDTTGQDMREVFDVNVFGVVDLTNALAPLLAQSNSPRVVMISSARESLSFTAPLTIKRAGGMVYNSSKSALNMITVMFAKALPTLNPRFLVNAASPGHVRTSFNNYIGMRTVEEGAAVITYLATLPEDGPNGAFIGDHAPFNEKGKFGRIPW